MSMCPVEWVRAAHVHATHSLAVNLHPHSMRLSACACVILAPRGPAVRAVQRPSRRHISIRVIPERTPTNPLSLAGREVGGAAYERHLPRAGAWRDQGAKPPLSWRLDARVVTVGRRVHHVWEGRES